MDDERLLTAHEGALPENLISIAEEFRAGFAAVDRIDRPAVSIFGSARLGEDSEPYRGAREVGKRFAEAGWAVITGGGRARTPTSTSRTRSSTSMRARSAS